MRDARGRVRFVSVLMAIRRRMTARGFSPLLMPLLSALWRLVFASTGWYPYLVSIPPLSLPITRVLLPAAPTSLAGTADTRLRPALRTYEYLVPSLRVTRITRRVLWRTWLERRWDFIYYASRKIGSVTLHEHLEFPII